MKKALTTFLLFISSYNFLFSQTTDDLKISNGSFANFVVDSKNNMHITWKHDSIWYGVFDSLGNDIKIFKFFDTYGCCEQSDLALTSKDVAVAWRSLSQSFNSYIFGEVFSVFQDPSNKSNIQFNDIYFDAERFAPRVNFLNDTTFIVVWYGEGPQTPSQKGIYGEITNISLSSLGGNFLMNDHLENNTESRLPQILVSKDSSKFLAVWNDNRSGSNRIYTRLFDSSGIPFDSSLPVSEFPDSGYIFYLSGATDLKTDNYAIVWAVENEPVWQVRLRWLNSNGIPIGPSKPITSEDDSVSNSASVDIDIDKEGKSVIVWEQEFNGHSYIFGKRFDSNNNPYGKIFKVSQQKLVNYQIFPKVQLKNDKIFVIWQQNKDSVTAIYTRIIDFYDTTLVGIKKINNSNPGPFYLFQNYPNPFNPSTEIDYSLKSAGHVVLKIFDMLGREIKTLINEDESEGSHKLNFDAEGLSSGIYFYSLTAGNFHQTRKMILLR